MDRIVKFGIPLYYVANLVQFKIASVSAPHPDAIDTFMHGNMATIEIITLLYMYCVSIPPLPSPVPTLLYLLELMLPHPSICTYNILMPKFII